MKKYEMIRDYRKSPKKVYENIGCIKGTHRERDENGEIICEMDFEKVINSSIKFDQKLMLSINNKFLHFKENSEICPGYIFLKTKINEIAHSVSMGRCNPENYIVVFIGGEFSREWYEFHIIAIIKEIDE